MEKIIAKIKVRGAKIVLKDMTGQTDQIADKRIVVAGGAKGHLLKDAKTTRQRRRKVTLKRPLTPLQLLQHLRPRHWLKAHGNKDLWPTL